MTIKAKIIADSVANGSRITTFELEYHRYIHSELMTHRLFSRNAASSRAIPVDKMMTMVQKTPAMPVEWGLNQSGMQAEEIHSSPEICKLAWKQAAKDAVKEARWLQALGLHKQIVNRLLEPFQVMKTIVTATEFDNFFWLRCHPEAQPEIHVLADKMYEEYKNSTPVELKAGQWHLPYVELTEEGWYVIPEGRVDLETAIKISASCCAQVSYRKLDDSVDKAIKIYDQLVSMSPVHASPFEHQATPMIHSSAYEHSGDYNTRGYSYYQLMPDNLEKGVTHLDRNGDYWSGNLKGFVQYRQLIDGNTCWDYEE